MELLLIEPVYFGCKWFYSLELHKTAERNSKKERIWGGKREINEVFHFSGGLYIYNIGRSPTFVSFPFCWLLDCMTKVDFLGIVIVSKLNNQRIFFFLFTSFCPFPEFSDSIHSRITATLLFIGSRSETKQSQARAKRNPRRRAIEV